MDGIEFYTQNGNGGDYKLPVVNLDRASDTEYPPQKKAFEMLKVNFFLNVGLKQDVIT